MKIIILSTEPPIDYGRLGQTHWSLRDLEAVAEEVLGEAVPDHSTIGRWLDEVDLRPDRWHYWKTPKSPQFWQQAEQICAMYLEPPKDGPILCYDEKTCMQALERERQAMLPGRPERLEFEYVRHGTLNLLAGFDVATGEVFGLCRPRRRACEFLQWLDLAAVLYRRGRVHVILDNLSTHDSDDVRRWRRRHRGRFVFHFLPTHGSWLNQVAFWVGILQRKCLKRLSVKNTSELAQAVYDFIDTYNRDLAHPFKWTYEAKPLCA